MKKSCFAVLIAGLLMLAPTTARAVTVYDLSDLIDNDGWIQSGDKIFSDFACQVFNSSTGFLSGGCDGNISAIVDGGNYGWQLQNFFSATGTGNGNATEDVFLEYTVSTASGAALI